MQSSTQHSSISSLEERLSHARLNLYSLDGTEYEYEVHKTALEFEIQTLEKEIEIKRRASSGAARPQGDHHLNQNDLSFPHDGNMPTLPIIGDQKRPRSNAARLSGPTPSATYSDYSQNELNHHLMSDGVLTERYERNMPGSWNFPPVDAPGALTGLAQQRFGNISNSNSGSSPESNYAIPRKKQKANFDASQQSQNDTYKSPSPDTTASTTPMSYNSFDIPEDMFAFLGGDPKESLKEMREEQRLQEQLAEQRRISMRQDEELARSLQHQYDNSSWTPSSRSTGPCNTDSTSPFQTRLSDHNQNRRLSPRSSPPATPSPRRLAPAPMPKEQQQSKDREGIIKKENTRPPSHLRFLPDEAAGIPRSRALKQEEHDELPTFPTHFIDIEDDTDSPSELQVPLHNGNVIDLDSDEWLYAGQSGNEGLFMQGASSNDGFGTQFSNAAGDIANGAAQFGQTPYNPAQELFTFDSGLNYDNNSFSSEFPSSFIDLSGDLSFNEIADQAFSRHGMDTSNSQLYQKYVDRINYVANDPTRTKSEIKALLENIRPDEDLPPENRDGTPEAMTYALMEHQKMGLTWLKKMETSEQKGGILADEMGLGKTIQALALMVSRRSNDPQCKTTLIVAPVALLKQWEKEITTKLKSDSQHKLKTYILHGSSRHQAWESLKNYDVVLTTFGTLSSELKRAEGIDMKKRVNPNWRPTSKEDSLPMLGDECYWYRVIIDEAQCIKNKGTKASLAAFALKAKYRLCMTGTPMMNNIDELYSLVRFLRISPYDDSREFSSHFSRPLKGQSQRAKDQAMEKLQVLLKAILLRRTKKSVIDGKPILDLPPRNTEARHATFSDDELEFYRALESRTQLQFNKYLRAGTVGRNYSNILVLLLRLRQACCHPHLIRDFAQEGFSGDVTAEEMRKLAMELAPDVVSRLKEQSELNDDSALECPICMDMSENATIFIPCGHNSCSECFARISDPSQAIASGDAAEPRNGEAKCPNCRGKITPTKVIDHNTFKKIHMLSAENTAADLKDLTETESETSEDSENDTDTDTGIDDEDGVEEEIDSKGNLKDFVVSDGMTDDEATIDDELINKFAHKTPQKSSKKKKQKGKGKARADKPSRTTLAQLKKESLKNVRARRRYIKRLEKEWETSAKIEETMEIIRDVQKIKDEETKQPEKIIIFSQFTSLLDLLEVPISKERWGFRRYDGSMNANQRNNAVVDFTDRKDVRIMLISLKAGNAGLNLTAASRVIMFDPFWNPYIEEQAVDRAHRIGQMRPVHVHRILIPNTVEDRILTLQEQKRKLIESALDENASQRIGRLGTRDLAFLFDVPLSN